MKRHLAFCLTIALFATVLYSEAPVPPSEEKAKADLHSYWNKKYKGETIESVESGGEPVILEKTDAKGKVVETKYKIPFIVVSKKGSAKTKYEAGANYILSKSNQWNFSEVGIGNVEKLAGGEQSAPAKPKVKEIILKALNDKYTGEYTFSDLKIDDGEFGSSGERFWYRYQGDMKRKATDGSANTCSDSDFTIQKLNPSSDWTVDITSLGRGCY
ncbi:hypothetical protein [Leptospira alstonii]|uniref:Uncharacterized protein n=2 Tax=Leptospira alstonii TaxID=28452 RepID=M6CJQ5_9LEPT|nr:hypothetical protein [Leptospira alstonii]EMJ91949.1 hypothetical protein LEP1GSC194_0671 [Leptospira alstonii serovar Sichuan str. 79601]EQA82412.1 hypothetical protein LEP1GSC193_0979 [Leptospira alstonii serovar Pingchang str. 80-412]